MAKTFMNKTNLNPQPPLQESEGESIAQGWRQTDEAIYGKIELPESGRVVAKPLELKQIWADARQPRRAIPLMVRMAQMNSSNTDVLLKTWKNLATKAAGQTINLAALLTGMGEGEQEEKAGVPLFDEFMDLIGLAASIHRDGLANPITVTSRGIDAYLVETGERRWLAYHLLREYVDDGKYAKIPARVVDKSDVWRQAAENGARRPLNAIGMARQLALLIMDMYAHDDGVDFAPYEKMVLPGGNDRPFYAQVVNGNVWRLKPNMSERVLQVTGLKSLAQVNQYRALLNISDELWVQADAESWAEYRIRITVNPPKKEETSTTVEVSRAQDFDKAAAGRAIFGGDDPSDDELDTWKGKHIAWRDNLKQRCTGVVQEVYRAASVPYPGALMLKVTDDTGGGWQVEAVNAKLLTAAPATATPFNVPPRQQTGLMYADGTPIQLKDNVRLLVGGIENMRLPWMVRSFVPGSGIQIEAWEFGKMRRLVVDAKSIAKVGATEDKDVSTNLPQGIDPDMPPPAAWETVFNVGDKVRMTEGTKRQQQMTWAIVKINNNETLLMTGNDNGSPVNVTVLPTSVVKLNSTSDMPIAQPHPPAPSPKEEGEQTPEHTLVMMPVIAETSAAWIMLWGLSVMCNSLPAEPTRGAIRRLLEAKPVEIRRFVETNGVERYQQMLVNDNATIMEFIEEMRQQINEACNQIYTVAAGNSQ